MHLSARVNDIELSYFKQSVFYFCDALKEAVFLSQKRLDM